MSALTLRPPTLEELPEITAFFAAIESTYGSGGATEGEIRQWLTSPLFNVEEDIRLASADGQIVGWIDFWDQNRAHNRLFLDVRAHPRDRAVYRRLLDWGEGRARELAEGTAIVRCGAVSDNEPLAAELSARGFRVVRHFLTMEVDLADEPEPAVWPEGIVVRTFQPDDAQAVYEALNEAFADHWDFVPIPFDEWREFFLASPEFDPSVIFIAEEDGQIAGVSLCRNERRPGTGHVWILGVRRPWRRRGLARALLLHSFAEFRRRGRAKADLGVDAENLTGAVRLYEGVGMHVARRFDSYEKGLPDREP
ncbi:MAG: GNAT family N-acetyltransferase [Actinomycetota bacterium]|nr:GNAT family N-acetyltransferase [Actinomycetota bacterium]